jgi:stage II sporulation protein GA (sporulation sigma-E factor processing peptidase)
MLAGTAVYVDILFLINFLMDYVILWTAARLAQIRISFWRLAAGAGIGALYSVAVLFPHLEQLSGFEVKFLVSLVMVLAAYTPLTWKKFGQAILYFYLVAFTLGGAVLGFVYFLNSNLFSGTLSAFPLHYLWLGVALVMAGVLGKYGVNYLKKSFLQDLLKVPVEITINGQQIRLNGLVDTGNQLLDPLTGAPVVIVEYDVLCQFLPPQLKDVIDATGGVNMVKLAEIFPKDGYIPSFRLIPFTTIGKRHGMLLGFRPDKITVYAGDKKVCKTDVIIGIYNRSLSPQGAYHALLHPDLLQASAS